MKLPKNIIKKYGISKKAWSMFKSRKKMRGMRMAKKKKYYGRVKSGRMSVEKALMGGFAVVVSEQFIDQIASKMNINVSDDVIKLIVGMYAARRGGFIGEGGKALSYIAARNLLAGFNFGGILSPRTPSNNGW